MPSKSLEILYLKVWPTHLYEQFKKSMLTKNKKPKFQNGEGVFESSDGRVMEIEEILKDGCG